MNNKVVISLIIGAILLLQMGYARSSSAQSDKIDGNRNPSFGIYGDVTTEITQITNGNDTDDLTNLIAIEFPFNNQPNENVEEYLEADCIDCYLSIPPNPSDNSPDNPYTPSSSSTGDSYVNNNGNDYIPIVNNEREKSINYGNESILETTPTVDENNVESHYNKNSDVINMPMGNFDKKTKDNFSYYLLLAGIGLLVIVAVWFVTRKDDEKETIKNGSITKRFTQISENTACYPDIPKIVYGILNREETNR